ncbi:MAG: hypothetical protein K0U76_15660 [Actinomycetia bacterium]|nr:hypothetical protein [Actinomycetes bacterium]MCH9702787.1 hypothetical protein [Actinomycetes bacterium]MCH9762023.1 hypothetical protein [Actinomycetes bacterium]
MGSKLSKSVRGLSRLATATGLAGLAIAVAGPASADNLNTTTCTQQQIMSSLQQSAPLIWNRISSDPQAEQDLRAALDVVLAVPPGQREQTAQTLEQALGKDQLSDISDDVLNASGGPIGRAVNNCHNH